MDLRGQSGYSSDMFGLWQSCIPDSLEDDQRRRARLLLGVCGFLTLAGLVVGSIGWAVEGGFSQRVAALYLFGLAALAAPQLLKKSGALGPPTHLIAAAGIVMLATNAYTLGGLHAVSLNATMIFVLVVFFLAGPRAGAFWAAASAAVITTFFMLDRAGHPFPMAIPPEENALMSAVSLVVQLGVLWAVAWLFERERRHHYVIITEGLAQVRAANEEQRATIEDLESFARMASHDLRGPAGRTQSLVQMLLELHGDEVSPGARRILEHLESSAVGMQRLVDDLLRLERVKMEELRREDVDLTQLVHAEILQLRAESPERHVHVEVQEGLRANGDPGLVKIALNNLLNNAWKYTANQRTPRIEVGATRGRRFFVTDNGVGFNPAHMHKLFQPFQRLHAPAAFPGSGVGLATVHRIITRHGGTIDAQSEPGEGAIFQFDFGN